MKLYIMKREALETLKANLPVVYGKYYTEKSKVNGFPIFVEKILLLNLNDVTEFKLADLILIDTWRNRS